MFEAAAVCVSARDGSSLADPDERTVGDSLGSRSDGSVLVGIIVGSNDSTGVGSEVSGLVGRCDG